MANLDLKSLARLGAEARLQQLDGERAAIFAAFPDLRQRQRGRRRTMGPGRGSEVGNGRVSARDESGGAGTKRRSMSAAARKAVSIRMKKYWAERRKAKGAGK